MNNTIFVELVSSAVIADPMEVVAAAEACDSPDAAVGRLWQLRTSKNPLRVLAYWTRAVKLEMVPFLELVAGK